jgi:hypothetical protein
MRKLGPADTLQEMNHLEFIRSSYTAFVIQNPTRIGIVVTTNNQVLTGQIELTSVVGFPSQPQLDFMLRLVTKQELPINGLDIVSFEKANPGTIEEFISAGIIKRM